MTTHARAKSRGIPRRGMVFLYTIGVFVIITVIGLSTLSSGRYLVESNRNDLYSLVALQTVYSGQAYGEAMIWRLMELTGRPAARAANFPCGSCSLPVPAWMGAVPAGGPYLYAPLTEHQFTFPQERVQGTTTLKVRGRFRIVLSECSDPGLPVPCDAKLFDENVLRNGVFWPTTSSPYKPTQQALGGIAPSDSAFYYTMRIVGEALAPDATGAMVVVSRKIAKLGFSFQGGSPPTTPNFVFVPRVFWFQSARLGG